MFIFTMGRTGVFCGVCREDNQKRSPAASKRLAGKSPIATESAITRFAQTDALSVTGFSAFDA